MRKNLLIDYKLSQIPVFLFSRKFAAACAASMRANFRLAALALIIFTWTIALAATLQAVAKEKDLSRLPMQSSRPAGATNHDFWEEADVPSDGRGFDPLATNSNDGSGGAAPTPRSGPARGPNSVAPHSPRNRRTAPSN